MTDRQRKALGYILGRFDTRDRGNGWINLPCPVCGGKVGRSGTYNVYSMRVSCWQSGCDLNAMYQRKGVSIYDFMQRVERGVNTFQDARERLEATRAHKPYAGSVLDANLRSHRQAIIELPPYTTPLLDGYGPMGIKARSYLKGRGYNLQELSDRYSLGYIDRIHTEKNLYGYLVIPFKDVKGKLIYYQLRDLVGGEHRKRWDNPPTDKFGVGKGAFMFNEPSLVLERDRLFLHEGATDCMTTGGVGSLGLSLSSPVLYKLSKAVSPEIVVMLDEGAFFEALVYADDLIKGTGKRIRLIPMYEGMGDPNELGNEECNRLADKSSILLDSVAIQDEFDKVERRVVNGAIKSFRASSMEIFW